MEVTLTRSNKGGEKIFVGNFGYHFRSRNANGEYRWVCTHRKSMLCKSSVLTKKFGEEHKISRAPTEHTHPGPEHEKVICKVNNYMKAIAEEQSTLKPSQIIQKVVLDVDPFSRKLLPSEKAQVVKIKRARAKKRRMSGESDAHTNSNFLGLGKMLKRSEHIDDCWDSTNMVETLHDDEIQRNIQTESEQGINLNSDHLEEQSLHINDVKFNPNRKPFVCSDQESDGTVNIRIFLEESLLNSFVINAQHTSNVNIRISKDDLQRNTV